MWLFVNYSKHGHIIYYWKLFFVTSMDLRSLPQNKPPFVGDQLIKFCHFSWESVLAIWLFSLWTEGTIVKREVCCSRTLLWSNSKSLEMIDPPSGKAAFTHTPSLSQTPAFRTGDFSLPAGEPSWQWHSGLSERPTWGERGRESYF